MKINIQYIKNYGINLNNLINQKQFQNKQQNWIKMK